MGYASIIKDVCADVSDYLRDIVPSYTDFAQTMVLPDGKCKGLNFDPLSHPAQACTCQAIDAGARIVTIAKPVQDGGTMLALVPFFRRAILERQTVLMCYPTGDSGKDIWTTKIGPVLDIYGGQEIKTGGGSKGGAARVRKLPKGGAFMLRSGGGRGESGQASVTGDAEMIDEIDDWPDERTILNVRKRIKDSPDPLVVMVSTIKKDQKSFILGLWDTGTQTHLEYPCPYCAAIQPLVWEQVDVAACTYRCAHCPAAWTEADRRKALKHWKRVDGKPGAKSFSIRWSCLDSPLSTLYDEINGTAALPGYLSALRHLDLGEHAEMRSFYRDRLTRIYDADLQDEEGAGAVINVKYLSNRSLAHGWSRIVQDLHPEKLWSRYQAETPAAAEAAVAIVDVQGDRIYWSVIAFTYRGSSWDIAWGQERCRMRLVGNDQQPEPWGPGDLMQTLSRAAEHITTTTTVPIIHRALDTRYEGREIGLWLKQEQQWRGIAGFGELPARDPQSIERRKILVPGLLGWDRRWIPGIGRFEICTERARERVHNAYRKAPDEPGAALLPAGLATNDHYLRHLCSWSLETDEKTKRTKWVQKQKRDDHLDTRSYGQALITFEVERRLTSNRS